ncbi:TonB-dependent receptor [Pseudochrobactrum asaccharolyticum]|uniref:Heme transporter BhuA n=1 Tax=Pseudochrobactrum asaccharolyticum TaxID=354351 RepID=A0A366DKM7_9HYPH|nr:TonB-dependent receptor [Pseudochrobactrum asaccharolyticum]RBO90591.1 hemoglobin/transferrin/lactoferrin receptor protein [Pseudochrobactrum asaccharolyticum]
MPLPVKRVKYARSMILRPHLWVCSVAIIALSPFPAYAQNRETSTVSLGMRRDFSLASQPLSSTIVRFSAQTGINILADGAFAAGIQSSPVKGSLTVEEALSQMLRGTGYFYQRNDPRSFTLVRQSTTNTDQATDAGVQLDVITIQTGNRSVSGLVAGKNAPYQTTAAVTSVDAQTLGEKNAGNLDAAIRSSAGTFTRKAMSGAGVAVNIRGMEGYGRVNMMIDGARQNIRVMGHGVSGGSAFIDSDLLAGLDMGRGSLSGAAGVGALGGAANFRTLGIDDVILPGKSYGALSTIKYGNNAYDWSTMAAAGMRAENGTGIMGAFNRRDSGAPKGGEDDNGRRLTDRNQAEDLKSGLAKLELGHGEDHKLLLGGIWYNNKSTIRGEPQDYLNHTYTARYDYTPDNDLIDLTVNAYYNDAQVRFSGGKYAGQFTRDKGMGIDVTNRSHADLSNDIALKLTYGGAYYHDDVTNGQSWGRGGPGDGKIGIGSLFADATLSYGMFDLTAGFHYDTFRLQGDVVKKNDRQTVLEYADRSDSHFNPRVTFAATPVDGVQFYTTYAKTFRPPTITETFFPGAHSATPNPTSPNPDLEGESSKGWEFGMNVLKKDVLAPGDALRMKANYFNNDVENYITSGAYSMKNMPMLQFVNITGKTRIKGFELETNYDSGFAFAGVTYSKTSTDLPYGMWSDGFGIGELNGLPDYTVTINAGFRALDEKLTIGGQVRRIGKTKAVKPPMGPQLIDVEGYMLADAYASYKYNENATFFVNIENITNKAYKPAQFMDPQKFGRGRTVIGGMTLRF